SAKPGIVIISTRLVAEIIQAVSAASILDVVSCASVGTAAKPKPSAAATAQVMRVLSLLMLPPSMAQVLQCVRVGLSGPDAHRLVDRRHEDLAVTDLTRLGGRNDRLDDGPYAIGRHRHLDADLRQKVHGVFGAAVDFGMPFLPSVAFDFACGHALHADCHQCVANILKLEWLDHGNDQFHEFAPRMLAYIIGAMAKD